MPFSTLEALQAFGLGAQMAARRRQLERQEREYDRKEKTREAVSSRIGAGDYRGATQAAIGGGEYDLGEQLGKLDESQRKQAYQEAQVMGRVASHLLSLPVEQRASNFQQLVPLLRQAGFGDEELAAADLSDESLTGLVQLGKSVTTVLAPRAEQESPFVRELNAAGIDPQSPEGREILRNRYAPQPRLVTDPTTGQVSMLMSPPGGAAPQAGPQPGQVVNGFRFRGGNPNDRNSWEPVQGGASPPGSHTFP